MAHEHSAANAEANTEAADGGEHGEVYDFATIQKKWQPVWEATQPFSSGDPADTRPRK